MRKITLIEYPSNLGLKERSPGIEPGVRKLPAWLRQHGFHKAINPATIYSLPAPAYSMQLDPVSNVRNADAIAIYAAEQAALLGHIMSGEEIFVVIGGDCSILIGTALALKQRGNYGLFYLDGHHDFMLPTLSSTHAAAGMDLAFVCGHGPDKLTNIQNSKPYFIEERIWCVGNREYDKSYVDPILASGIHYLDLPALRQKGMQQCARDFLTMIDQKRLDGFWIHFDVDALDDEIMPAVDSRNADGLSYPEMNELLKTLFAHPKFTGIEITILDPDLDLDGKYTIEFVKQFSQLKSKN